MLELLFATNNQEIHFLHWINSGLSFGTRQRLSFSSGTNQTEFVFFWLNLSLFILQYSSTIRFLSLHSTFQGKSYDIACNVKSWHTFLSSGGRVNTKQRMPAQPTISHRLALIFSSQLQSPPARSELSASLSLAWIADLENEVWLQGCTELEFWSLLEAGTETDRSSLY